MDLLVKHMIAITGIRDRAMLDISLALAVQELAAATQTRVLSVLTVGDRMCLRSRATIDADGNVYSEELHGDAVLAPLLEMPSELSACLSRREPSALISGTGPKRILWVPIWSDDKATTCLEIVHYLPFAETTVHIITGIVGLYRNFSSLLDYSERDSLTGLLNRKTFEDELARMFQPLDDQAAPKELTERRCTAEERKGWLAAVDVDHFKTVNDTFGHLYGDEVLIMLANELQTSFRATDRVFRFGGEEFVILLRPTTLNNASRIIDRFRSNVEARTFPQVGRVTVSVGFVAVNVHDSPVATLGHADQALYFAKTHGRNRACHYDELIEQGLLRPAASNYTAEFF